MEVSISCLVSAKPYFVKVCVMNIVFGNIETVFRVCSCHTCFIISPSKVAVKQHGSHQVKCGKLKATADISNCKDTPRNVCWQSFCLSLIAPRSVSSHLVFLSLVVSTFGLRPFSSASLWVEKGVETISFVFSYESNFGHHRFDFSSNIFEAIQCLPYIA